MNPSPTPVERSLSPRIMKELPREMVEEILVNLPVKSLLRFSSVSKTWESIILGSRFVKRYRVHEGREMNIVTVSGIRKNTGGVHIYKNPVPSYTVSSLSRMASSSSSVEYEASSTELIIPGYGDFKVSNVVVAFCDELWLVSRFGSESFYLWNPSTRRHKKLPNPSFMPDHFNDAKSASFRFISFYYGIGYDSIGDDYKILKFPCGDDACAELYSLRSDSWRDILNFPKNICEGTNSVYLNGKIHWLRKWKDCHLPRGIISFDLSTDKLGEVIFPPLDMKIKSLYVSVLRGTLCMSATSDIVDDKCEIWMMEEYGVASSWTIKFTIKRFCSIHHINALCILENGLVLVNGLYACGRDGVFVVDGDGKSRPHQLITCGNTSHHGRITTTVVDSPDHCVCEISGGMNFGIVYVDSLVAPDAFNSV